MMVCADLVVQDEFSHSAISDAYEFVNTILPAVSPRSMASNP